MAPWEISQLDRHMLSYCVSLENTPTQVCGVATAALLSCCPVALPRRRMLLCWSSRLPRAAAAARSMVRDAAGCLPASPPVRPHGAPDAHTRPYSGAGARVHRAGEADGGGQAEKVCSLALQPKCSVLLILIKGGEGQGAEELQKLGAPRFGQAGREGSLANQIACACARARAHTHTHSIVFSRRMKSFFLVLLQVGGPRGPGFGAGAATSGPVPSCSCLERCNGGEGGCTGGRQIRVGGLILVVQRLPGSTRFRVKGLGQRLPRSSPPSTGWDNSPNSGPTG